MGGREKKSVRDERYRENALALADTVRIALKTAVDIGVPATAWAWTFWRVPWAWVGKPDADKLLMLSRTFGEFNRFDPPVNFLSYNGALPGMGDRIKISGTEYKVVPYTENLLSAARTELRDDLIVAVGPLFVLAIAPTEIGVAEKTAIGVTWAAAQLAAVELARFVPKTILIRHLKKGDELVQTIPLTVYELDWLDRIAFSAQAPLLAHILIRAFQPGTD